MKILLETKDRGEVIKWMISILTERYEYYTSLYECKHKEMADFINFSIKEVLCDVKTHFGIGFVGNIGNILNNDYVFCINCDEESEKEGTYRIIYYEDGCVNECFVDGWVDWSLWDDYDICLKEACLIFESNV